MGPPEEGIVSAKLGGALQGEEMWEACLPRRRPLPEVRNDGNEASSNPKAGRGQSPVSHVQNPSAIPSFSRAFTSSFTHHPAAASTERGRVPL